MYYYTNACVISTMNDIGSSVEDDINKLWANQELENGAYTPWINSYSKLYPALAQHIEQYCPEKTLIIVHNFY